MQNAGGARGKGGRFASARNTKSAWLLDVDRTPVPPKKTPYVRFATYAGYINLEIPRGFSYM
jgi:hypothetical protein